MKYNIGDLVIIRGRALSLSDNAFSIGMIVSESNKRHTKEYNDMWCTKELIWEKVYKVLTHGRIIDVTYYQIKGKAE